MCNGRLPYRIGSSPFIDLKRSEYKGTGNSHQRTVWFSCTLGKSGNLSALFGQQHHPPVKFTDRHRR